MADPAIASEAIPTGWVLSGIVTVIGTMALVVRWAVGSRDKIQDARITAMDARIQALERKVVDDERRIEERHDYERTTLATLTQEGHARERRLASIIARHGDPSDQRDIPTEPLHRIHSPLPLPGYGGPQ